MKKRFVELSIKDEDGRELMKGIAPAKDFSTGSKGFYVSGKFVDPDSDDRYQVSCNMILIGSKPKKG